MNRLAALASPDWLRSTALHDIAFSDSNHTLMFAMNQVRSAV